MIDPATNTGYLTHKNYVSGTSGPARWFMDAINLSTGTEKPGFPVELTGTAQNQPSMNFQPTRELQRPGLLLMNGVVYAAFGADCDLSPYQGWVFGVSTSGQTKARWVARSFGDGAGIWQSGAGLTSDGPGSLLISTGNGGSPNTPAPGSSPPENLGESIVRLAVQGDGSLKAVDFFTPFDAAQLDAGDADFASGGITGLNAQYFGTPSIPHLAVAVGKDGYVYLLNRDELGGFQQGSGGADKVVQRLGPYGGVWSRPGVWPGDGGWVYIPTASGGNSSGGSSGFLRVYRYGLSGTGQPSLSLQATSPDAFGFTSSAPVITSEGTNSGSALVWVVWAPNGSGEGAQLRAYDPVPVEGKPVLRFSAPVGTSAKFALPGVGAGRIYVGTRDGKVLGFGSPVALAADRSLHDLPHDDDRQQQLKDGDAHRDDQTDGQRPDLELPAVHAWHAIAGDARELQAGSEDPGAGHLHAHADRTDRRHARRRNQRRARSHSRCRAPDRPLRRSSKRRPRCSPSAGRRSAATAPHRRPSATSAAQR